MREAEQRGWRHAAARVGMALTLLGTGIVVLLPGSAEAATTTFSQTGDIDIASSTPGNQGPATPYPSTITVPAGQPAITTITVTLDAFSHNRAEHVDMLLVGPTGLARTLMSDAGAGNTGTSNATLTFVVSGSPAVPATGAIPSGTYTPANYGGADAYAAPAPASGGTGLASFVGTNPVGTWSLYIVDDQNGQQGSMSGWSITLGSANTAPVADDDTYGIGEDSTLNVPAGTGVLAGDTDADSDTLTAGSPIGPSNGSLTLDPDGSFGYSPNADFNGTDSFTYTVSDGNGGTDTGAVTITVNAVNDPPVADDESYTVAEDGTLVVAAGSGVLAGDTDIDGGALTAGGPTGPGDGSLTLNADGSFDYSPNADFNGTDSFTYSVSDGNGGTDTGAVTITVEAVNDAPVADDDAYSVAEDGTLVVTVGTGVLDGDTDVDGDTLTVTGSTLTSDGSIGIGSDGSFTYTPNADFVGTDSFDYTVSDGNGGTDTGTVTITVGPNVNDSPVADDDTYAVGEDGTLTVGAGAGLVDGDSDVDGGPLSVTSNTTTANGSVSVDPDGGFTYTPDADFNGSDSFTYQVSDGSGGLDSATVSITVTPVADAPVADDDQYTVDEDGPLTVAAAGVLDGDTDADGDGLSAGSPVGPSDGILTLNADGSFVYTPAAEFSGTDSFTYTVDDGNGGTDTGTVTITVNAVNDAPVADDDGYAVPEDGSLSVAAGTGVLAGDTDVEGGPLTVTSHTTTANGAVSVAPDGSFTYTPNANFVGTDSFDYTVADADGGTDTGTVTITVGPNVNDAPMADDDDYAVAEDGSLAVDAASGVLAGDSDGDGDPLAASVLTGPAYGTLALDTDGSFTYTPDADHVGVDSFTYTADDGNGGTGTATVTVTIGPNVNDAPDALDDSYNVAEDGTLDVLAATGVLNGDTDADGDTLAATVLNGPANGTLDLDADGAFTYEPDANFTGTDSFTYTVRDGNGGTDTATVQIAVGPDDNDAPVADDDVYTVDEDDVLTVVAGGVLDGDADADGDALTASLDSGPAHGDVTLGSSGSFTYAPDADFNGSDSFTYTVADGNGGSDTGTVTITVAPVNDAPQATPDSATIDAGDDVTIDVVANDDDLDGDALAAAMATAPARGAASCAGATCTFDAPAGDAGGEVTFDYTVSDGDGGVDTATVTVMIRAAQVTPTTEAPTTTATTAASPTTTAPAVGPAELPRTGQETRSLLALGQVLLGLGILMFGTATLLRTPPAVSAGGAGWWPRARRETSSSSRG